METNYHPVTVGLYRSLRTEQLLQLRVAFELDAIEDNDDIASVAFCRGRIALIDRVLAERAVN